MSDQHLDLSHILMTSSEVAKALRIEVHALRRMAQRGDIGFLRIDSGKWCHYRFLRSEVELFLKKGMTVQPKMVKEPHVL